MNKTVALDRVGELYGRIGETTLRTLVDRFYDVMDSEPSARDIRTLHPSDLSASRDKLFWFLVGRFGGPPLYAERRGHPQLRARHNPFPIGERERNQWIVCMDRAIAECIGDANDRSVMESFFRIVADAMVNR